MPEILEIPEIRDISVDIETLGISEKSPVLSIAAIAFDRAAILRDPSLSILNGDQIRRIDDESLFKTFYTTVSLLDCLALGCVIEKGTAVFWQKQQDRSQLIESMAYAEPIAASLNKFGVFINGNYKSLWAKSPTFDLDILKSLAKACEVKLPIDFRKEADIRTEILDYPEFDVREVSKKLKILDDKGNELKPHNPLYDAVIQLHVTQEVYAIKFASRRFKPEVGA